MNAAKWAIGVTLLLTCAAVARGGEATVFDFESGDLSGWEVTGGVRLVREAAGVPANGSAFFALLEPTPEAQFAALRRTVTVTELSNVQFGRFFAGTSPQYFTIDWGDPPTHFAKLLLGFREPDRRWVDPAGGVLLYPGTYTLSFEGFGATRYAVDNIVIAPGPLFPEPGTASAAGFAAACLSASRKWRRSRRGGAPAPLRA